MRKLLTLGLLLVCTGAAVSAGDDARAIVNKAIKAAGGEAKLEKFQSMTWNEKGVFYGMGEGIDYTGKYAINRPDQFRMEIEGVFIIILNGDKGWVVAGGQANDMKKDQLDAERFNHKGGWIMSLLPLKDKAYALKSLGSAKVNGKETSVVEVSRKDHPTVKLYFDKKTDLLIKGEFKTKAADLEFKEVVMVYNFSGHKEIQGAKMATKISLMRDDKKFVEAEFSDLKAGKVDAKVFQKPAN